MHQVTVPSLPATTEESKNTLDAPINEVKTQMHDVNLINQKRHTISGPTIKNDSVTSPIKPDNPQRTSETLVTHVSGTGQPNETDRKDKSEISNTKSAIQIKATKEQANKVSNTAAKVENFEVARASNNQPSTPTVTKVVQPEVSERENHSANKGEIAIQDKSTTGQVSAKSSTTDEKANLTQARSNQLDATAEQKMLFPGNVETKVSMLLFDQSRTRQLTCSLVCLLYESLLCA